MDVEEDQKEEQKARIQIGIFERTTANIRVFSVTKRTTHSYMSGCGNNYLHRHVERIYTFESFGLQP